MIGIIKSENFLKLLHIWSLGWKRDALYRLSKEKAHGRGARVSLREALASPRAHISVWSQPHPLPGWMRPAVEAPALFGVREGWDFSWGSKWSCGWKGVNSFAWCGGDKACSLKQWWWGEAGAESRMRLRLPNWISISQFRRGEDPEDPVLNVLCLMCLWSFQVEKFRAVGHLHLTLGREIQGWGTGLRHIL